MKIINFHAENFMRLSAVSITPKGSVVEITGRNEQGKSSVLTGIRAALGGENYRPTKPIRKGEEKGVLRCELGDGEAVELVVTVTFRSSKSGEPVSDIRVENPDGSRHMKPQQVLTAFLGALTLDPFEFARMKPPQQFDVMRQFVPDVDFVGIERARQADYDRRRDLNRDAKAARTAADQIRVTAEELPAQVDEAALVERLTEAGRHNAEIDARSARRDRLQDEAERDDADAYQMELRATSLEDEAKSLRSDADKKRSNAEDITRRLSAAPALPEPMNIAEMTDAIGVARGANQRIADEARNRTARQDYATRADALEAESAALTAAMEAREADKVAKIAAAELPVPGLTFGDGAILLDDLPFEQASKARKIRTSFAIAAAQKSKLRIAFIDDAALLDDDSLALIAEEAESRNMQVWMETIRSDNAAAFFIEDGQVREPELALQAAAE